MVADELDDPFAARAAHRRAGEHPAQLLGGPGLAPHGRPQAPVSARRAGPGGLDVAAPPALRRGGGPREGQRAGADPAARRGAALLARQRRGVAGAGRLDEDRTGLQTAADGVVRRARDAGADRTVLGRDRLDPSAAAQLTARGRQLVGPPRRDQLLGLGGAGEAPQESCRALLLGAHQQDLAGVRVGGARLGVEVVAVVPDDDQAEVVDRGEGCRSGADHDPPGSPRDSEEVAVAGGGTAVGGEGDVVALAEHLGQGAVDPGHVAAVRHAHERTAARCVRRSDGFGHHQRPVVRRSRRPHRARITTLGEPAQERVGVLDGAPGASRRRHGRRSSLGRLLLRTGMAWRHRQAQHVRPGSGVAVGQGLAQRRDLGCQHRLRADHPAQGLELAGVVALGPALDDVAVHVLAGEPHLHPRTRERPSLPWPEARRSRRGGRGGPGRCRRGPARPGRPPSAPRRPRCACGWPRPWPGRHRRQRGGRAASRAGPDPVRSCVRRSWAALNQRAQTAHAPHCLMTG